MIADLTGDYAASEISDPLFAGMSATDYPPLDGEAAQTQMETLQSIAIRYRAFKEVRGDAAKTLTDFDVNSRCGQRYRCTRANGLEGGSISRMANLVALWCTPGRSQLSQLQRTAAKRAATAASKRRGQGRLWAALERSEGREITNIDQPL